MPACAKTWRSEAYLGHGEKFCFSGVGGVRRGDERGGEGVGS